MVGKKVARPLPSTRLALGVFQAVAAGFFSAFAYPQPSLELLKKRYPDALGAQRHFLITEVTLMGATNLCVAAVDLQRLKMVRLLPPMGKGFPIGLFGNVRPNYIVRGHVEPVKAALGFPHETEDTQLSEPFEICDSISEADLYHCLADRVDACVADIFNGNICDKRYVIDGTQCRSLGGVLVDSSSIYLGTTSGKPKLSFKDAAGEEWFLPITDLLVANEPAAIAAALAAASVGKERLLLRIGLARGFDGFGKFAPKRCYVQVNGIVFPG